jgi:hypothetical protein
MAAEQDADLFGREVFKYVASLVPYWRVADEAWSIGTAIVSGIGVERNFGQILIVPICGKNDARIEMLCSCSVLPTFYPRGNRIIIIWDDRTPHIASPVPDILKQVKAIPWSRRSEISPIVDLDSFFYGQDNRAP